MNSDANDYTTDFDIKNKAVVGKTEKSIYPAGDICGDARFGDVGEITFGEGNKDIEYLKAYTEGYNNGISEILAIIEGKIEENEGHYHTSIKLGIVDATMFNYALSEIKELKAEILKLKGE